MSTVDKLASSLGRKDEVPNTELANAIVKTKDATAIKELVDNLGNKNKDIHSDCIKVLYEIGEQSPELIASYCKDFIAMLQHKNNRMVWGAMTALGTITTLKPKELFANIVAVLEASDKGSVIAKDHAVNILIKLSGIKAYADDSQQLLLGQMKTAAPNQLPMYAENAITAMQGIYKKEFISVLNRRLDDMEKESKRKRIEKVLKKLNG